jgi:HK97 gp10 family phage protein
MAVTETITFKGLKELEQALDQLPIELKDKAVRKGLRWGADVLKDGMTRRAPRAAVHRVIRRGRAYPIRLADSIVARVRRVKGENVAEVGPGKGAFWGRFQEHGTRFMAPQRFMTPTLTEDSQIAIAAFVAGARQELETITRRLRRTAT